MSAGAKPLVPPPLRPGDRVGIAAPGGPIRAEEVERGLDWLRDRGYEPVAAPHLRQRRAYLAGSDADRLADLNGFLRDPAIAAIWFARGGYGTGRIVDGVDFASLRRRPRRLIGYSDLTVLHAAVWRRLRLRSFYGPLVGELGDPAKFDEASLRLAMEAAAPAAAHAVGRSAVWREGRGGGPLLGGCLSLLVSLVGTPHEPSYDGAILFWEEVNEEPYRIDRMLGQLRQSGRLGKLRGMIVGALVGCAAGDPANDAPLADLLDTHLAGTRYPVLVDFPAGHGPKKVTLPLGWGARIDTTAGRLELGRS